MPYLLHGNTRFYELVLLFGDFFLFLKFDKQNLEKELLRLPEDNEYDLSVCLQWAVGR